MILKDQWLTWPLRGKWYKTHKTYVQHDDGTMHREIEVTISPTGRSVQVYVDGVKWGPDNVEEPT